MSANDKGIVAVTGRAHCQRQVAFLCFSSKFNVLTAPDLANGINICHYVTQCDLLNTFE